ncbi:MAG: porin family protein [Planctomycetota bacterium]|jgi:hypothetical protein
MPTRLARSPLSKLLVVASFLAAGCSAPSLRITPRVAFVDLDGTFAATAGAVNSGSSIEDLGLDDTETEFIPRADFEFGPFQWTVDYGTLGFSGSGIADNQITIGGVTVPASGAVDSEIDLALYRSTFTWDLVPSDTVDLGLGFGLGAAEVSATITDRQVGSPTEGQSATTEELIPLPYAAASATFTFGDFGVEGLLGLFSIDVEDVEVQYFDLDLNAYWQFVDVGGAGFRLTGGWRLIDVQAQYDDADDFVDADLEFSGPYAGITVVL